MHRSIRTVVTCWLAPRCGERPRIDQGGGQADQQIDCRFLHHITIRSLVYVNRAEIPAINGPQPFSNLNVQSCSAISSFSRASLALAAPNCDIRA
jgi:hypothetical protein